MTADEISFLFFFVCLFRAEAYGMVPRLGAKLELQVPPTPQPQQHMIRVVSVTYTTAHGDAGSLTH